MTSRTRRRRAPTTRACKPPRPRQYAAHAAPPPRAHAVRSAASCASCAPAPGKPRPRARPRWAANPRTSRPASADTAGLHDAPRMRSSPRALPRRLHRRLHRRPPPPPPAGVSADSVAAAAGQPQPASYPQYPQQQPQPALHPQYPQQPQPGPPQQQPGYQQYPSPRHTMYIHRLITRPIHRHTPAPITRSCSPAEWARMSTHPHGSRRPNPCSRTSIETSM